MPLAMNTTPIHFLAYDPNSKTWEEASFSKLVCRDNLSVYVIPVDENGKQGEQCTWGEWLKQQKGEDCVISNLMKEVCITGKLVRYTCRFFVVIACINIIVGGIFVGRATCDNLELGTIIGIALGAIAIFFIRFIIFLWQPTKE